MSILYGELAAKGWIAILPLPQPTPHNHIVYVVFIVCLLYIRCSPFQCCVYMRSTPSHNQAVFYHHYRFNTAQAIPVRLDKHKLGWEIEKSQCTYNDNRITYSNVCVWYCAFTVLSVFFPWFDAYAHVWVYLWNKIQLLGFHCSYMPDCVKKKFPYTGKYIYIL